MPYYYRMDSLYLLLVIPCLLLSMVAQGMVKGRFNRYSKERTKKGLTGSMAARQILSGYDLDQIPVERVPGQLTDHYSPKEKILRLSDPVYGNDSIASVGVAAHEAGHAIQDAAGYWPGKLRTLLVPAAQIGSTTGPYLIMFGFIMDAAGLLKLGIILFALAVAFYVVTLPVEFDASLRAVHILDESGLLDQEELVGVKKVLRAAALTYIASAATAFAQLIRFIVLARRQDDR